MRCALPIVSFNRYVDWTSKQLVNGRNWIPASVAGRYGVEGVRLHRLANGEVISRVGERCWVTTDVVVRVEMPEPVYSWPLIEWSLRGALEQIVAVYM